MKIFGVHFSSFFSVVYFIFLCVHFLHFLHFLLPPIVEVDISDIAIISVIPDMVKAIISGITNTPQKTYRIAQYTDSWNQLHSLYNRRPRSSAERVEEWPNSVPVIGVQGLVQSAW